MPIDAPRPSFFKVSEDPSTVAHRWEDWKMVFECYLTATGVKDLKQKRALLLSAAGEEVINILCTLVPGGRSQLVSGTVEEAIATLDAYFAPKINRHYERFKFFLAKQEANESIDGFVTRLKKLAQTCNFSNYHDELLIMQVILKCHSVELRRKLLQDPDLTLEIVLKVARAREAAFSQATAIENSGTMTAKNVSHVTSRPTGNQVRWNKQAGSQVRSNPKHKNSQFNRESKYNSDTTRPKAKANSQNTGNPCYRCGYVGHSPTDRDKCPATGKTCSKCKKIGHFANQCGGWTRKGNIRYTSEDVSGNANSSSTNQLTHTDEGNNSIGLYTFQVNQLSKESKRKFVKLKLNGKEVNMQIDTAADITVLNEFVAKSIPNLVINKSDQELQDYNRNHIKVKGSAMVDVQYQGNNYGKLHMTVVEGHRQSLIGLDWLNVIPLDLNNIFDTPSVPVQQLHSIQSLTTEFADVFNDQIGTVRNIKASLSLKPEATPKFCPPRAIPFAIKPLVEQEIHRLEANNTWEKVEYSPWATPLVPVVKDSQNVRLCGDYKVTVNPHLQVAQHPLPKPEDMFAALGGCRVFSKIDLRHAFQQLEMDEKSQEICTVNTHLGLFRPKRLPYGIASSPALWQANMDRIFNGMQGVFIFVDDILVAGKDEAEHNNRLRAVFKRIKENGLKIKKEKCIFATSKVEYLGFKVDAQGIHKTTDKVEAIRNAKIPENVSELQSFLGLVTFYSKFIPNLATIAHPLYNLLRKDSTWKWTNQCRTAIESIKAEVISPRFLTHFNPNLPVKLVCDASSIGIGAVLAHVMPNGDERPIAFASRSLNNAEKNYSQIEKEALALIYGVKKFHIYLYGKKKFTLVTDHKPLLAILGPKAGLPLLAAARLQRWAIILAAYSYELEYRNTTKMGNADALSRLPVEPAPSTHESSILLVDHINMPITAKTIAQHTQKDPVLSRILQGLVSGRNLVSTQEECKKYLDVWSELSTEQGCILRGARVVVPESLQNLVLKEIHADHQGIVRSKAVARSYVWWPGIDKSIEDFVKTCNNCSLQQNNPKAVRLHPWEYPKYPWQRIHIDFAGPYLGQYFLIIVDAYSKWPEIIPMHTTTAQATIKVLMQIFATHGLPERIISDNGPQFVSTEFSDFLKANGIQHSRSAPYHPASNGEAERFVQTFKHNMKCKEATPSNVGSHISKFLLTYRTTPHASTGQAPSLLLMGRRLRNRLDLMTPSLQADQDLRSWNQVSRNEKVRHYAISTPVLVRIYDNKDKWQPGIVSQKVGDLHYDVEVNGHVTRRHIDQIRPHEFQECPQVPQEIPIATNVNSQQPEPTDTNGSPSPRVLPPRVTRGIPPERMNL